ncbi:MAG: nucleotidyltransferase family protein [Acidobacteriota bacterium]
MIAGIILAAGASSRMGSPKALLDYRGETFIERLVRVLSLVCNPVTVVLGYHAAAIRPGIGEAASVVINPAPERGQLSSLQTALAALPADAEGFLVTPVDSPAVEIETVEQLAAEFRRRDPATLLVIPRVQTPGGSKRGHPIFAARAIAEELLALPATAMASDVIHRHIPETLYVEVNDSGILTDIDDREGYRRLSETVK